MSHDFNTWLPAMSARGVILPHDSQVRANDFGVWRLVEDLHRRYPVFDFEHCNGLAVVAVGSEVPAGFMGCLFADDASRERVRRLFAALGTLVAAQGRLQRQMRERCTRLQQELDAIHRSLAWRITRRLREASRLLSGVRSAEPAVHARADGGQAAHRSRQPDVPPHCTDLDDQFLAFLEQPDFTFCGKGRL